MLPEVVKEDYVEEIMGQNVANRLIIFWMIRMRCVSVGVHTTKNAQFCNETVSVLRQRGSLPLTLHSTHKMTYLDSFMFAWRRIKKPLHFLFYRLGRHVSTALPLKAL